MINSTGVWLSSFKTAACGLSCSTGILIVLSVCPSWRSSLPSWPHTRRPLLQMVRGALREEHIVTKSYCEHAWGFHILFWVLVIQKRQVPSYVFCLLCRFKYLGPCSDRAQHPLRQQTLQQYLIWGAGQTARHTTKQGMYVTHHQLILQVTCRIVKCGAFSSRYVLNGS